MDREQAIDILKAVAVCSVSKLHCYECPFWEGEICECSPWTDEEATEAVRFLNRERKDNERKAD